MGNHVGAFNALLQRVFLARKSLFWAGNEGRHNQLPVKIACKETLY
jgi:hypothetical protein